jgi:CheY-like chemotaxis protein
MSHFAVLVVEDDAELGDVITLILQEAGYETELARDGTTALKRIQERIPNLIMLDMHLPNMSGLEILNIIRSDPRLFHTQVMVTTADPKLAQACEGKADLIFLKPYSVGELIESVSRFSA